MIEVSLNSAAARRARGPDSIADESGGHVRTITHWNTSPYRAEGRTYVRMRIEERSMSECTRATNFDKGWEHTRHC